MKKTNTEERDSIEDVNLFNIVMMPTKLIDDSYNDKKIILKQNNQKNQTKRTFTHPFLILAKNKKYLYGLPGTSSKWLSNLNKHLPKDNSKIIIKYIKCSECRNDKRCEAKPKTCNKYNLLYDLQNSRLDSENIRLNSSIKKFADYFCDEHIIHEGNILEGIINKFRENSIKQNNKCIYIYPFECNKTTCKYKIKNSKDNESKTKYFCVNHIPINNNNFLIQKKLPRIQGPLFTDQIIFFQDIRTKIWTPKITFPRFKDTLYVSILLKIPKCKIKKLEKIGNLINCENYIHDNNECSTNFNTLISNLLDNFSKYNFENDLKFILNYILDNFSFENKKKEDLHQECKKMFKSNIELYSLIRKNIDLL